MMIEHNDTITKAPGTLARGFLLLVFGLLTGCTGSGVVNLVPFNRADFPQDEPLIAEIPIHEAYWWRGDEGELNLALAYRVKSIFGRSRSGHWLMSMVLDGWPAGKERLYRVGPSAVRILQSVGGSHRRARSLSGIAVIRVESGNRLSGRFHVSVLQQKFGLLTGWTSRFAHAPQIVIGRFKAVEDREAGRAILEQTEAEDFGRPEAATPRRIHLQTRPASRPATRPEP
jgi:hypothetical protein